MRRCSLTGLSVTVPWRWWSHTHGSQKTRVVIMNECAWQSPREHLLVPRPRETWLANHPGTLQKHNESEFTVANLPLSLWATSMRSGRIRQIKIAGFLLSVPGNWRWRANLYLKMQHDCLVPFRLILLCAQFFLPARPGTLLQYERGCAFYQLPLKQNIAKFSNVKYLKLEFKLRKISRIKIN